MIDTFAKWMLDAIRAEGAGCNWVEEQRFEWTSATAILLTQILAGKTVVLITDVHRKWFQHYISQSINQLSKERPLIPIISLDRLYPEFDRMTGSETMQILIDLLELSYKGDYFFWYIGRGGDSRADIAKRSDQSCLWFMDETFVNAVQLRSSDPLLDIKLLQLYRLFDKALDAALFGEVILEG